MSSRCRPAGGGASCGLAGIAILCLLGWLAATASGRAATVVVPKIGGVFDTYARLHSAGLRVNIPHGRSFDSLAPPRVSRVVPATGRRVPRGSVVTLYLTGGHARLSIPPGRLPQYVVPNLVHRPVSDAFAWVRTKRLDFRAYLGPLHAGDAQGLLANYRVTRQRPSAGGRLALGVPTRTAHRRRAGLRLTPLAVWGTQPPPPCTPPRGYALVASSPQAVITSHPYEAVGMTNIRWYGCLRAVDTIRPLSSQDDWFRREGGDIKVALAGPFAALMVRFVRHFSYECTDRVEIYDLNTGQPGQVFTTACLFSDPAMDSLSLNSNGFAAWRRALTYPSCDAVACLVEQLYAHDNHGTQLLDSSSSSARNSLTNIRFAGNILSWTNAGIARQAALGRPPV